MTMTADLSSWLLERIAFDDDCLRDATRLGESLTPFGTDWILAQSEAKRQIITHHTGPHECPTSEDSCGWTGTDPCLTLRILASAYRDDAGYRSEWAP